VLSKALRFDEFAAFLEQWRRPVPVLCVPTTFSSTPPEAFAASGVAGVIWANHLMRAAVEAMQEAAREIVRAKSAAAVEHRISTVPELWRLQRVAVPLEAAS
jgi:phosphoenolpyruvate phosphomutase